MPTEAVLLKSTAATAQLSSEAFRQQERRSCEQRNQKHGLLRPPGGTSTITVSSPTLGVCIKHREDSCTISGHSNVQSSMTQCADDLFYIYLNCVWLPPLLASCVSVNYPYGFSLNSGIVAGFPRGDSPGANIRLYER